MLIFQGIDPHDDYSGRHLLGATVDMADRPYGNPGLSEAFSKNLASHRACL